MRRWNGWGDETVNYHLPSEALAFLAARLGEGWPQPPVSLEDVVATVPESRLPSHPLVQTDAVTRLRHARGQSLPDWVALRGGRIERFPDGVAYPQSAEDVAALVAYAREVGAKLIPYGGGTSVVGHINPPAIDAPILTMSLRRMNGLVAFDERDHLATFGAGVNGPELEAQLRARGYTLGHFPQSFEYSTLGGWVATRSSGQQSLYYGRIEQLFAGGEVVTPAGKLVLPPFPASAAGPDLRETVLGSEGRLGVITQATVRVSPLPAHETFRGVFFPNFERGMAAVRAMAQARLPLSMLRLSGAEETHTSLMLAGKRQVIALLERYVRWRGAGDEKCLLIFGVTGDKPVYGAALRGALAICRQHGGVVIGAPLGEQWRKSRFRTPYLRNALWERGYAVDTLETAVTWSRVTETMTAIEAALRDGLAEEDERVHVFSHLSHVYSSGSSIYTTYVFRLGETPEATLARWRRLKTAASEAIRRCGGTISHQHGVGVDHAPYLAAEKGALGMAALQALARTFDPDGLMNTGKLLLD